MSIDVQGLIDSLEIKRVEVDSLIPYARNSKTHSAEQVALIASHMQEVGWTNPILIDGKKGIIAGHGRLEAARKLKLARVPVIELSHLSEAQKRALVIWDNRSTEFGTTWNLDMLKIELDDLAELGFDIGSIGFDEDALAEFFPDIKASDTGKDPNAVPDVPEEPISKLGDIWILGPHRVRCGDSTKPEDWTDFLGKEQVDMVWTDPPYNVAYESKLAGKIKNDDMGDAKFRAFLTDAFSCLFSHMKPGAAIYVAHADTEGYNFRHAFREAGFKLSGCLVWKKDSLVLGRSDFQWMHEPILYGWKPGSKHRWYGGRKLTTVQDWGGEPVTKLDDGRYQIVVGDRVLTVSGEATLEESPSSVIFHEKPKRSEDHPTMKPVGLIEKMLKCNARPGDIIADAFGGSGSTLIAAERMGMCARLQEFDPKFVDVIVRRYEEYSGRKAVHAVTGAEFPADRDTDKK